MNYQNKKFYFIFLIFKSFNEIFGEKIIQKSRESQIFRFMKQKS